MAITIESNPQDLTTIGNPITFVVSSTNYTQPNFLFIADVYILGTLFARLKSSPNPTTNYGYFNIREILRSEISTTTAINEGRGFECPDMWRNYEVKFSEQYTGASTTTYDWSGIVYCGAIPTIEFPNFNYLQYVCTDVIQPNPVKLLTNRPQSTKAVTLQGYYLQSGFLYIPCNLTSSANIDFIRYKYYNNDNSVLREFYFRTKNYDYHASFDPNINAVITVPFMPNEVYQIPSGYTSDSTPGYTDMPLKPEEGYYSLTLSKTDDGTAFFSDEYFVYLDNPCERYGFTEIHFQNQLGGIDSYVFTKPKRERQSISRNQASRPLLSFNGDQYNYNVTSQGMFNTKIDWSKEFTVTSDWLTDSEFEWLQELVRSPRIWLRYTYLVDGSPVETLLPILITDTAYNVYKRDFDKLNTLSITYKYTIDETSPL